MKIKYKTKEQQHEENLKTLQAFRPLDDDFMRELFRNNLPLAQMILRIITGMDDLVIVRQETQYDLKRLMGARSICLDVMCVDSKGRFFNIEIQKEDEGADPYRARYHLSSIDVENLRKNQKFKELPDTYVIFITEKDIFDEGEPIYKVERVVTTTNKPFNDGEHIIYVNGAYEGDTELGWLMHDFRCTNADDMHYELLAERTRYYKEDPKGVSNMCKLMEDRVKEEVIIAKKMEDYQIALKMLEEGELPCDRISAYTGLTIEELQEIAEEQGFDTF